MSAIVMGILNALIGIIMMILATALEFFADTFLDTVQWDFSTFDSYLPFFSNVLEFFKVLGAGWLSVVGLLFILKCFGFAVGLQIQRSRIWQFVIRYLFFGFLAIQGWNIMSFAYLKLIGVIDEVIAIDASSAGDLAFVEYVTSIGSRVMDGLIVGVAGDAGSMIGIVKVLVILIVTIMLVVNFFKLISMFFIRYVRLVFLVALAPIVFGMAILEETKPIFNTYIRTFFADMFVFIMTAFFIKGFISVMSASNNLNLDGSVEFTELFQQAAYRDLIWAFFALAYSTFAVQFDQFVASLGLNISRGGSAGGTGILGAIGASAMMLRRAIGHGATSAGLSTPFGNTFSKNWNDIKGAVLGGARAGFASGTTKGEAFAMGAMGAAKGFASTTNLAKAAAMTKDGSSFAEAMNQKFDKRFGEMQDAAKRGMSQKDFDATKKRAEQNGFTVDQQRARDAIINDMKVGNITPAMAQSRLAAQGLLREDEQGAMSMDAAANQYAHKGNDKADSMADDYQKKHVQDAHTTAGEAFHMPEGTTLNANESLRTSDGMTFKEGTKNFPDGTKISSDGSIQFSNDAVMSQNLQDSNGNALPEGAIQHSDGIISIGNQVIGSNGVAREITRPTRLPDGTIVRPNGDREINGGVVAGGVTIDKNGVISHGNSASTQYGITKNDAGAISHGVVTQHSDGSQTFSDGSILLDNGNLVHMNGEVTRPDGSVLTPQGDQVFADGSVLHSNGDVTANGVTRHKDGSSTYPNRVEHGNGAITYNDGHVAYQDGIMIDGKGGISFDNGNNYQPIQSLPEGKYVHEKTGDVAYADGTVYHSASKAVSNAEGYLGRVNHADGNSGNEGTFSLGGTVYWSNGTAANPDKTVEFDEFNGGMIVKDQTIIHQSGTTKTITTNGVTKVIRADGHTTFGKDDDTERKRWDSGTKFSGFGMRSRRKKK